MNKLMLVTMAVVMAASLSACGRKAPPVGPEGAVYKRTYPDIQTPYPGQVPQSEK